MIPTDDHQSRGVLSSVSCAIWKTGYSVWTSKLTTVILCITNCHRFYKLFCAPVKFRFCSQRRCRPVNDKPSYTRRLLLGG